MLGFLKKLVTKSDSSAPAVAPAATPARPVAPTRPTAPVIPARSTTPERSVPPTARPSAPIASGSFPAEAVTPVKPVSAAVASQPAARAVDPEGTVDLPFKQLFPKLSAQVQALPHQLPDTDGFLRIPLGMVRTQLAKGAVKLPFSQFREFSPSGVFPEPQKGPDFEVEIPLSEIVSRIKPEVIGRRTNQRKIEVPEKIAPLFNSDGKPVEGLKVSDEKSKPSAKPAKTEAVQPGAEIKAAAPEQQSPLATEKRDPKPVAPPPPIQPATPLPSPADLIPSPNVTREPEPGDEPTIAPRFKVSASEPLVNEPIRAPRLDPSLASLKPKALEPEKPQPAVAQNKIVAPSQPASGSQPDFIIAFMDLVSFWTDSGKQELANLYRHSAEIPRSRIEQGLRRGKINFTWREFKPWVKLAPGNSLPTIAEEYEVELPLAIVAPRFFQDRNPGKPQRRIAPSDDIPDVFAVKSEVASRIGANTEVKAEEQAPAPADVSGTAPIAAEEPVEKPFGFESIFNKPGKSNWSFSEVTENCAALEGVAGALISDSEGLLIAGQWGGEGKADSVAAFIPQMHRRFVEYATELKLGEGENFTFKLEN
ncbi:MAG: hypothetical protein ACTHMT_05150, partial [Verrucomicrobiota bacterium]